jgi:2-ketoarginine methyltransferase
MPPSIGPSWVKRLCDAIGPIREGFAAQIILGLFESGIYSALEERPLGSAELAEHMDMREDRLNALIAYAINEELLVRHEDGTLEPSARLSQAAEFRPWYEMLLGGYGGTLARISPYLGADSVDYAPREVSYVSRGSSGISQYDTIPLLKSFAATTKEPFAEVLDIGCADASYLVELCASGLADTGVGLEPDTATCERARRLVEEAGLASRIELRNEAAQDYLRSRGKNPPSCCIAAFVLQELLEQESWEYVCDLLRSLAEQGCERMVVIEVDHSLERDVLKYGLGRTYYNPYFLLHAFTCQRLMPRKRWEDLFAEAGWIVRATAHPHATVDPTEFEIGFLLERKA